jgi:ATP-dependent protease ClpP protease subunit/phage major head subunit gpT-like protein
MTMNEIVLHGSVGASFWDEAHFTAAQVREQLAGMTGDIVVRINSGGGIAAEGQAIYTMLRDYPGKKRVVVDAVAASAASLIAMAGDEIVMRRGAWMLIHDPAAPWLEARGTEADHLRAARQLGVMANAYAEVYAARAGITREEARQIMRDEVVLDGGMAVQMGFATATDDTDALEIARFDYRIYAHAPEAARAASESFGESRGELAILASIAGLPRISKQEPLMADEIKAVEATTPADDVTEAPAAVETVSADTVVAQATAAERNRARRIVEMAAAARLPEAFATAMIAEGVTLEDASDRIVAEWRKGGDVDKAMMGAPVARVIRDERETKREGAVAAIVAQLGRTDPATDKARPFMGMKLAEMAAEFGGYKGALRTAADTIRAVEMSMHATSDFPLVLENALNKRLQDSYAKATPTYQAIAERMDFTDFRPHPIAQIGDYPGLTEINEGGEIQFGTVGEKRETLLLRSYASGISISRQMIVNDDLSAIDRILSNRGQMVALEEDRLFWTMFVSGANSDGPTLTETTRQVFNTTDATKAGTATAITVAALGTARAAMRVRRSLAPRAGATGQLLNLTASILLVGPDKETEAQTIVAPIQAAQASNVNPFSGTLRIVVSPYITGNAWYLFADPSVLANFAYGFLRGEGGPRMRMDEPFGVQGMRFTVEHDFGVGAIDFRAGWRNAGA